MTDRRLDRRRFLRVAAAGAAGVIGGPVLRPAPSRAETTQADVLIIGAGMAGVSAGSALRAAGIHPIVLEGRSDRIGGRIWSSYAWPDAPVDLGASWLTHATINPLATLAEQNGIQFVESNLADLALSEARGRVLPDAEVARLALLHAGVYADVKLLAQQRIDQNLPDLPASDAFAKVYAARGFDPATLQKLYFFLNYSVKEPEASPLCDLSLKYWDDDYVFVQLYTAVFPQGYVQLVNRLAMGLDIRLNHVVSAISYGPQGVSVATNQGQFTAPYAVVTLPHGVLSSGAVEFSPPLPAWKQGAIQRIHTGLSDKLYLRFPSVFWNPAPNTLGRIAETEESPWSTWINFYKLAGVPMLMVFNHADYALQLEAMTDTEVTDTAMQVLRKQYGRSIPDPIGMQRSKWAADPFANGTVPHTPPGASGNDYALMGMPVGPLGFAGDSTTDEVPTLVFGAYLTGQREANRILTAMGLRPPQPPISLSNLTSNPGGGPGSLLQSAGPSSRPGLSPHNTVGQLHEEKVIIRRRTRGGGGGSAQVASGGDTGSRSGVNVFSPRSRTSATEAHAVPEHARRAGAASSAAQPSASGASPQPAPHASSRRVTEEHRPSGQRPGRRRP
jgi:monoamine oxidase